MSNPVRFPNGTQTTNAEFVIGVLENQSSQPSTPAAGFVKLYSKTDNKLYRLDSSDNEVEVGSGSGGGGGGSLQWVQAELAPIDFIDAGVQGFDFEAGLTQYLYTSIKVPESYTGAQIIMRAPFYCQSSSGNVLMQTRATLIRPGTDLISSTTNQRTSTNAAVSLSGGTVNVPQMVSFDLTSNTGQINGVTVAAGHLILIRLTRATDTAALSARMLPFLSEVSFT